MRKLLLIACVLGNALLPTAVQAQVSRPSRELLALLQKSKPDTNRVQLLQELSLYYMFKPQAQKADMDSATGVARQAEKLSVALRYPKGQANSYLLYAKVYNHEGKRDTARALVAKAITVFIKFQYMADLGEAYFDLASYYALTGTEMTERIRLAEMGLTAFQKSGNKLKQANGNKELGDLYQFEGNNFKALASLRQALILYKSIDAGYYKLMGAYDLLGQVSTSIGEYKDAIEYGLLAVQAGEQAGGSTLYLATVYNRLGVTYQAMNELEEANVYFYKSIAIAKRENDPVTVYILASNIANTLVRLNRPVAALAFLQGIVKKYPVPDAGCQVDVCGQFVQIYQLMKRYPEAQQQCNQLLQLAELPEKINKERLRSIYSICLQFFLASGQYKQAQKYIRIHRELSEQMGLLRSLSNNHLWSFQLDSAQGNFQAAILHYQRYNKLTDSLFNNTKSKQIAQLQIQFETEKKDKNIKLNEQNIQLLTKQGILQHTQLQQADLVRNVTFITVAFLLIIVGLLYNRYRIKQRNGEILEAQQIEINDQNRSLQHLLTEKEWLLKEIHHRVKNNLQIVMSLLNSQSVYLTDEAAVAAIRDSQHRVQAISLIHQKLYQSENLSAIDMPVYIRELVEYLRDFFDTGQRIRFETHIDPVKLNQSYAVPLGLILNEAITNGIKYAFPENRSGLIRITFQHANDHHYVLTVSDNGIGLPVDMDGQEHDSLGMSLMRGLSEEIEAHFTISNENGTIIKIRFIYEPPTRPEAAGISPSLPFETTAL